MKKLAVLLFCLMSLQWNNSFAQSPSFKTYVNPVIPGDHPDPTLTKVGNYFYTSGSSFNPTPRLYRSTDLVHWKVIAQPVLASWGQYNSSPGGGVWGGHMVYYNHKYWHYYGLGDGSMYFVTANNPEGPWSTPVKVNVPSGLSGLGVDNSIFIDKIYGSWYMLTKNGRQNNHIVELGDDGQPTGKVLDLTWLNPQSEGYPYGWAEGPVMWKHNGYYYYNFAQNLAGAQYVMKSDTLTDNSAEWTIKSGTIFTGGQGQYDAPNHISPAVMLEDSTSWVIGQSYNKDWYAQGRQGLLMQVTYDAEGFPQIHYPSNTAVQAPKLPNNGIPWMVPKSDMFDSTGLNSEWSFLGYTPDSYHSLTDRPGWLHLDAGRNGTCVIKNDGEHQYTLITRLDFNPAAVYHRAGLEIINGPQTLAAKVYSTVDDSGNKIFEFSFNGTDYKAPNKIGSIAWLKLVRNAHEISGYYSSDGANWSSIGNPIDARAIDIEQTQFNDFTGNKQGLFVQGTGAYFDLYIYRDAYSKMAAQYPANYYGVTKYSSYLGNIHTGDWAMYAGVDFGKEVQPKTGFDYQRTPGNVTFEASSGSSGGNIEVWIDSLDTGTKIAETTIGNTDDWRSFDTFSTKVDSISGRHDVYLRFTGNDGEELLRLKNLKFTPKRVPVFTGIDHNPEQSIPDHFRLYSNYPNPFNPTTVIRYQLPFSSEVNLRVYNYLGRQVALLIDNKKISRGIHSVTFDGSSLSSGVYLYRLKAGNYIQTKKMILLK